MVGVPRSQGCRNCRRKKKGCDLQQPVCGQCARLNLSCGWDDKKWTFVSQDPASTAGTSKLPIRNRSAPDVLRGTSPSLQPEIQANSFASTAYEVGSIGNFWDQFLPKDGSLEIGGVYAGLWVKTVKDLAAMSEIANLSLTACAVTAIGCSNGDYALLQRGMQCYAKALRATNKALQDPTEAQSDAVLASCKLLSVYENFRVDISGGVSTQGHDWHNHIDGICRIIELRGPSKHVSQHGHALFEESRISAIIAGMALRKANFLSEPAWHSIPWETYPRNIRDQLLDCMVALPDLLAKQDILFQRLKSVETNSDLFAVLTEGQDHLNRCMLVATSLRDWEQRALALCIAEGGLSDDFAGPITLLEVCKEHGYGFFHMIMVYWAACIVLYSSMWVTKRNITSGTEQVHPLPSLMKLPDIPTWMTPRPAAQAITKCAPHYFAEEAGIWSALSSTFPIGAALHFYAATAGPDSEELQQLRQLFAQSRRGYVAGEFLRSIANTAKTKGGDPSDRQQHTSMARSWYGADSP